MRDEQDEGEAGASWLLVGNAICRQRIRSLGCQGGDSMMKEIIRSTECLALLLTTWEIHCVVRPVPQLLCTLSLKASHPLNYWLELFCFMHACHFSAVRTGMRIGCALSQGWGRCIYLHRSRKERQHRERTLCSWPQSIGFYLLIFLQRNLVVCNYLLDFPLWVLIIRCMAQREQATSLPSLSPPPS